MTDVFHLCRECPIRSIPIRSIIGPLGAIPLGAVVAQLASARLSEVPGSIFSDFNVVFVSSQIL